MNTVPPLKFVVVGRQLFRVPVHNCTAKSLPCHHLSFSTMNGVANVFDTIRQHLCPVAVLTTCSLIIPDALCVDVGIVFPTSHCSHRNLLPLFYSPLLLPRSSFHNVFQCFSVSADTFPSHSVNYQRNSVFSEVAEASVGYFMNACAETCSDKLFCIGISGCFEYH
jgi:hypothetical protein